MATTVLGIAVLTNVPICTPDVPDVVWHVPPSVPAFELRAKALAS